MSGVGRISRIGFALSGLALLAGCSLPGPKPQVPISTYLLEGSRSYGDVEPVRSAPCLTLAVGVPRSAPGFSTSRMAYVEAPNRIDYFAYHEWADTPARMMLSLLERRLDASGLFRAVMTTSRTVIPDLRLDTTIFALQQVFDNAGSRVELQAKFMLYDIGGSTLLLAETFELSEPAEASSPEAGVAAANRAVERLLTELMDTMRANVEDIPCTRNE